MPILNIVLVINSIVLIAVILLQSGKSAGLGAIDGGATSLMGGKGRKLDDLLFKVTIGSGTLLVVLTLLIGYLQ